MLSDTGLVLDESSEVIVRVSRKKVVLSLLAAAALIAGSVALIAVGSIVGWLGLVFAPAVPIALLQLVRPAFVRIGGDSITVRQMVGRTRTYEFGRMGPVAIWSWNQRQRGVAFDYEYDGTTPRWQAFTRRVYGVSEHISDVYQVGPAELAEVISVARDAATGSGG